MKLSDTELRRLDSIESRCMKATPPPWMAGDDGDHLFLGPARTIEQECSGGYTELDLLNADGDFIVEARKDVPWLVALVRRLAAGE